jgi:hypothetical protein
VSPGKVPDRVPVEFIRGEGAAMTALPSYAASHANCRGTKAEMEARAEFLIDYAEVHGPVTVRGL